MNFKEYLNLLESRNIQHNKYYIYSKKNDTLTDSFDNIKDAENFYKKYYKEFDKDGSDSIIASGSDLISIYGIK